MVIYRVVQDDPALTWRCACWYELCSVRPMQSGVYIGDAGTTLVYLARGPSTWQHGVMAGGDSVFCLV